MTLLRFLGNGPFWPSTIEFLSKQCERHWWSTLLYVQNYVNPTDLVRAVSSHIKADCSINDCFLQKFLVLRSLVVFVSWYAAILHITSHRLLDLSIQNKGFTCYVCVSFGLCWLYFGCVPKIWNSWIVCSIDRDLCDLVFLTLNNNVFILWSIQGTSVAYAENILSYAYSIRTVACWCHCWIYILWISR